MTISIEHESARAATKIAILRERINDRCERGGGGAAYFAGRAGWQSRLTRKFFQTDEASKRGFGKDNLTTHCAS